MVVLAVLAVLSVLGFAAGRETATPNPSGRRLVRFLQRDGDPETRLSIFDRADAYARRLPFGAAFERRLVQAGVTVSVSALLLWSGAGLCITAWIAGAVLGPVTAAVIAAAAAFGGDGLLRAARSRRTRRMETQLPSALDMLVGQLRSHRSIGEAIADVARWVGRPLGGEFARVAEELRIGVPLPRALQRLCERVAAPALPGVVTAILVADRTGANLADCLTRQAAAVRAQVTFRQEVSAMTAHARATGATLALLPIVVAVAMIVLDRGVFEPMLDTVPGQVLLGAACAMEGAGWLAMRWMIRRVDA